MVKPTSIRPPEPQQSLDMNWIEAILIINRETNLGSCVCIQWKNPKARGLAALFS